MLVCYTPYRLYHVHDEINTTIYKIHTLCHQELSLHVTRKLGMENEYI